MAEAHATGGPSTGEPGEAHHTSVWPFVIAMAAGVGFGGLALRLYPMIAAGAALLIVGVGGWLWQDARGISFAVKGAYEERPFVGISRRKLGMWIFVVTEIFFFSGLIAAGLALRVHVPGCPSPIPIPAPSAACWPGPTATPLNIPLTAVNTFILITSSLTMVESLHHAQKGNASKMKAFLLATLLLGITFVSIQAFEYFKLFYGEGLTPWPNADPAKLYLGTFGTAFYAQTGFHGAHVTGGILALAFLNAKAWRGKYGKHDHEAIELVGLYWHFVDIVWIFLFPLMYLIGR